MFIILLIPKFIYIIRTISCFMS